ncbi:hypothetical protein D3C71_1884120 [compost metagenome]
MVPPSPIHRSGAAGRGQISTAAASGNPSQRNRPRQRQMNRMPRKATGRAAAGALATVCTAPGSPAVQWPMASIRSTPLPASHRKGAPSPSGSSAAPSARAGIRMKSAIGDVARLAIRP